MIRRTICSLMEQDLFDSGSREADDVEIVVVPNGCSDQTAAVARESLTECAAGKPVRWKVCELSEAGKSNAWNTYVHELSDQSAEFIILLDADVEFGRRDVLRCLVEGLRAHPSANVAAATLVKAQAKAKRCGPLMRLSLAVSRLSHATGKGIAGGCYCGRGPALRGIWMPVGLLGEDGFLRAMIVTDRFTRPDDLSRRIRVSDAIVYYEPERTLWGIFRHSRRLVIGTAMNAWIYTELWRNGPRVDGGTFVREQNAADPQWARKLIVEQVQKCGWWVLPQGVPFSRMRQLRKIPWPGRLKHLPLVLCATLFEIPILLSANRELKRQRMVW